MTAEDAARLACDGFATLRHVLTPAACAKAAGEIGEAMAARPGDSIQSTDRRVVGGRNLLSCWAGWRDVVRRERVRRLVLRELGPAAGVVRILYFDKPPGRGWSLALHRDRTIAVQRHRTPPTPFAKPTRKAGVPHVEANQALLSSMLTLRLHLDAMHAGNGPLIVAPGSHLAGPAAPGEPGAAAEPLAIHCDAGDIFVMRPLLSHGSLAAHPNTEEHRRVLHLELAPSEALPGGYRWHDFHRVG